MSTVIGVLPTYGDVDRGEQALERAGFPKRRIQWITDTSAVRNLLHCEPSCVVTRYAALGALTVAGIYGLSAILAGWCECNLFNYDQAIAVETILAGLFVGGFIGAVLGVFGGAAVYEKDTHLYTRGVQTGEKLIVVETIGGETERAIEILQQEGFIGVKTLQQT